MEYYEYNKDHQWDLSKDKRSLIITKNGQTLFSISTAEIIETLGFNYIVNHMKVLGKEVPAFFKK